MNITVSIKEYEVDEVRAELEKYASENGLTSADALDSFVQVKKNQNFSFPERGEDPEFYDLLVFA